jgi:hypothetical protein
MVHRARRDRAPWHSVVGGLEGVLSDDQATLLTHGPEAQAAVCASSGEDDAYGARTEGVGQRPQKVVERQPGAMSGLRLRKTECALGCRQIGPRRDDVDTAGRDPHAVDRLADRHGGMLGKQAHHHARVCRIQVLDENEGRPGVRRERAQQPARGVESARRGADPDDRKRLGRGLSRSRRRRICAAIGSGEMLAPSRHGRLFSADGALRGSPA